VPSVGSKEAYEEACKRFNKGQYARALEITRQLYTREPGHPAYVMIHTAVLGKLDRVGEAEMIARRALRHITKKSDRVGVLGALVETLNKEGELGDTEKLIRDEIEKQPEERLLVSKLAHVLTLKGKKDEVFSIVDDAESGGAMTLGLAGVYGRAALRSDRAEHAMGVIERTLGGIDESDETTDGLHHAYNALGHLYDKFGRYDDAMAAFRSANEQIPAEYSDPAHARRVAMIEKLWTPEVFESVERPSVPEGAPTPVFIVGMPRSGTTLTEQIIDAHPEGFGAGELGLMPSIFVDVTGNPNDPYGVDPLAYDPALLAAGAQRYRDETLRMAGSGGVRVITDKAPTNFWHMCLIMLMLPDARIIHCTREPRDNCLSCYFQSLTASHTYSVDLGNCGRYYRHYHAAAAHQTGVLERIGAGVFENVYEDTVDDQEGKTRALLDFVGLGFHEDALAFHESGRVALTLSNDQVRQPIYKTSKNRYERYAAHLGELEDALGDLVSERVSPSGAATEG
jgi:tetratricopeptide (TPR) repeat protein